MKQTRPTSRRAEATPPVLRLLAQFLVLGLCPIAGCERDGSSEQAARNNDSTETVAIAYALGGKGDMTYNDAASRGADALRKERVNVREFQPSNLDDYTRGIDLLSVGGPNLLFCVGFLYDDPVRRIAPRYPDVKYIVLDGAASGPNIWSIKFAAEEGAFLAGSVAAAITQSRIIAFIGGSDIPIINEFLRGFKDGATFIDPQVQVVALYVGSGGTAFTDPVRGREVALTALSRGADVLFSAAGSSGNGVIEAAKGKGVFAIGVDVDQSPLAPDTVVTSVLKNFDVAMLNVLQKYRQGTLVHGEAITLGIEEHVVSLAPINPELVEKVRPSLERAREKLRK